MILDLRFTITLVKRSPEYLDSLRNGLYQNIQDADMLVQLLMDCTSQEINYGIRINTLPLVQAFESVLISFDSDV